MAALQKRENKMRRTPQEKRKMRGRHFRRKKIREHVRRESRRGRRGGEWAPATPEPRRRSKPHKYIR